MQRGDNEQVSGRKSQIKFYKQIYFFSVCREQFIALHQYPILENLSQHFMTNHVNDISKQDFIEQQYTPKTEEEIKTEKQRERQEDKLDKLEESYVTNMARRGALFQEIPQKGKLDLNLVKDSTYFFS